MAKLASLFHPRFTLAVHIVQIVLILLVLILSIVRVSMSVPITRANIMSIPISIKGLIIVGYQILTERKGGRFHKWASLKANMILNFTEVLFWAVLMGLVFSASARFCIGASCAVTLVIGVLCVVLFILGIQAATASTMDFLHFRRHQFTRGSEHPTLRNYDDAHRMEFSPPPQ